MLSRCDESQLSRFNIQRNVVRDNGTAAILGRLTQRAIDRVLFLSIGWSSLPGDLQTQAAVVADEIREYCRLSALDALDERDAILDAEIFETFTKYRAEAIELVFLILNGRAWSGCAEEQYELYRPPYEH